MEVLNLEDAPKINTYECLWEGTEKLITNFPIVLKMSMPVVHITLATALMLAPVYMIENLSAFFASLIVMLLGLGYFLYGFWEFLLGLVGVSYLAKDIMENKEIKTVDDYYSYVRQHSKSYIKYWLIVALVYIMAVIVYFAIVALLYMSPGYNKMTEGSEQILLFIGLITAVLIPYLIILFPLSFGTYVSYYFWAYRDKNKVFDSVKEAIKTGYKKIIPAINFLIYYMIISFLISCLFSPLMSYFVMQTENVIPFVLLNIFLSLITTLFMSFIGTKFYFNLQK